MTYNEARNYFDTEVNTLGDLWSEYKAYCQRFSIKPVVNGFKKWLVEQAEESIYCKTHDC